MKECKICTRVKENTEFYKNNNYKDGLEYRCKVCRKAAYPTTMRTVATQKHRAKYGYPIYTKKRIDCLLEERTKEMLEMLRLAGREIASANTPSAVTNYLIAEIKKKYGL